MAAIGTLTIEMAANVARLQKDMETARRSVDSTMKQIQRSADLAKKALGALGVAMSAGMFVKWIDNAIKAADEMKKLSQKTGVAVKDLAGLQLAYKQSGLGADALLTSMSRLSKGMAEGNKAFSAMGLSTKNTDGTLKSTRQMLGEVADKFASYRDGAEKTALAMQLFGKSGADLIPLLNSGAKSLAEYDEIARKLGLTLDEQTAASAERFNDTLELITEGSRGLSTQLSAKLLPTLETMAAQFLESTTNGGAMEKTVNALVFAFKALYSVGIAIVEVFSAVGTRIGATAAMIAQAFEGDFKGALKTWKDAGDDIDASMERAGTAISSVWADTGNTTVAAMVNMTAAAKAAAPVVEDLTSAQNDAAKASKDAADEEKRQIDAIVDSLRMQAKYLREVKQEEEERRAHKEALSALVAENAALDADLVGGDLGTIGDIYARETAILEARYNREFELIDQMIAAKEELADSERDNMERRSLYEEEALELSKKRSKLEKKYALEQTAIDKAAYKSRMSLASAYAGYVSSALSSLADTQDQTSRDGFETAKALQMSSAVINTAGAIMNALATVQPYPLAIAAAAAAAASGAAQISTIQSTKFGGTSSTSSVSSGGFSSGTSSVTGSSIGQSYSSVQDLQTAESLQALADAADNASLAVGKMSDVLTSIEELFGDEGGISKWSLSSAPNIDLETGSIQSIVSQNVDAVTDYLQSVVAPFRNGVLSGIESIISGGGSSFTSAIKSMALGSGWTTKSGGVALQIVDGELQSAEYVNQKKSGGLFGSSKYRTTYSAMDTEFADMLTTQIDKVKSAINLAAAITGTTTNFSAADYGLTQIETSGRSADDIEADLEEFFQDAANALAATTVGLQEFAFSGENAFDALVRLATALQSTNEQLDLVGLNLLDATMEGANAAYKLQELMGGSEDFADKLSEYFSAIFADDEQSIQSFNRNLEDMRTQINLMNSAFEDDALITLPQTRAEFRALVESLDLMTDQGATLFSTLMDIAPAFGEMIDYLEELADDALDDLEDAVDAQRDLLEAQKDTIKSLFSYLETQINDLYKNTTSTAAMGAVAGRAFIAEALMAARSTGTLPDQTELANAVSSVTSSMTSSNYSSAFEMQRDRLVLAGRLSQLKDITGTQLSTVEEQLLTLDSILETANDQVDALKGIDNSVLTVAQAVANLQTALTGVSTGIPQMATGTNYVPADMLAMVHEGEAIVPKEYNPAASGGDVADELRQLREENRAQARAMVALQQRMTRLIEKWDGDGMPEERAVA